MGRSELLCFWQTKKYEAWQFSTHVWPLGQFRCSSPSAKEPHSLTWVLCFKIFFPKNEFKVWTGFGPVLLNLQRIPVSFARCWLPYTTSSLSLSLSLSLSHSLSHSLSLSLSPTRTYLGRYYPHPLTYTHPLSTYFPPAPPLFALMPFSLSLSLSWGPLAIESSCNPQLNLLPNKNVFIH